MRTLRVHGQLGGTGDGFAVTLKCRMVGVQANVVLAVMSNSGWVSPLLVAEVTGYSYDHTIVLLRAMVQAGWVHSRLEPDVIGVYETFRLAEPGNRMARAWSRAAD